MKEYVYFWRSRKAGMIGHLLQMKQTKTGYRLDRRDGDDSELNVGLCFIIRD